MNKRLRMWWASQKLQKPVVLYNQCGEYITRTPSASLETKLLEAELDIFPASQVSEMK